jgi:hypothetical protein
LAAPSSLKSLQIVRAENDKGGGVAAGGEVSFFKVGAPKVPKPPKMGRLTGSLKLALGALGGLGGVGIRGSL